MAGQTLGLRKPHALTFTYPRLLGPIELGMTPNMQRGQCGVWEALDSEPGNQGSYLILTLEGSFFGCVSSLSAKGHGFTISKWER